jgi:hypothetical protein
VRTSLLAASIQLTDVGPGDGGFCVLRGSHKANFRVVSSFVSYFVSSPVRQSVSPSVRQSVSPSVR